MTPAVESHQTALKAIVVGLFALLRAIESAAAGALQRAVFHDLLRILRPAESAVRRLIVIVARGMTAGSAIKRPAPHGLPKGKGQHRTVQFQLFDPRKRFGERRIVSSGAGPRVFFIAPDPPLVPLFRQPDLPHTAAVQATAEKTFNARMLALRLKALSAALDDLPRQARRLVRLRARRAASPTPKISWPLRPGTPPGHRKNPLHKVDDILAECHFLASDVRAPDTS